MSPEHAPAPSVPAALDAAGTATGATPDTLAGLPVVVIGAGPVGLAAAAHLADRDIPFLVLEAGDRVGAAVHAWGHVKLFSPWRYDIDAAARTLLEKDGWTAPDPDISPTGAALVEHYLAPLAATPRIAPRLRLGHRVVAISRVGTDRVRTLGRESAPFLVRVAIDGVGADSTTTDLHARAIIDASGTWRTPNVLGASGLPAHGETEAAAFIDHALPDVLGADRSPHAAKHTLVVGAGHSAANTALALAELADQVPGTRVTWAIRSGAAARTYGGGEADALPERGALGTRLKKLVDQGPIELVDHFSVHTIRVLGTESVEVESIDARGVKKIVACDRIVAATGFRPDHSLAAELRLDLDPILGSPRALAPLIDPNEHSCGTVPPHGVDELAHPEPGFYAVGMKSYGRAPTFLLATGYEQARSVVAALAGDWEAARDVRLELPETGVCNTSSSDGDDESGCCGTPAPVSLGLKVGLATGVPGGLHREPLTVIETTGSAGCCG